MQKPVEHAFSSGDRVAIVSSFAVVAFFAAVVVICVLLSFAGTHAKDDTQAQVSLGGASPDSTTSTLL